MGEQQRERRGLQDGNDRIATIARWLRDVPDAEVIKELVLECWPGDEEPEQSRRWPKESVSRELAPDINDLITDYAADCGTTINARLKWVRADSGATWLSKKFRATCPRNLQEAVVPLDASNVSQLAQNQRHTEALAQTLIEVVNRSDARFLDMVDKTDARTERMFGYFDRMLERLDKRAQDAEQVADTAGEQIARAEELAEEAIERAEGAIEQAEAAGEDDKVARVIDIAFKKLSEG